MKEKNIKSKVNLKETFFALSNKNRLLIYEAVLKKEMNITQLSKELEQKYYNVLKNLKILKEAKMVSFDKRVTEKSQETFVKGIPFNKKSVYQKVYLELIKDERRSNE